MIFQNIRNYLYLPDDAVSHSRRLEFNVESYLESAVIKWIHDGQNVSVLLVFLWYVYTEGTGGCFAQIKPTLCGNTSLFTKHHQQKVKMS